VSQTAVRAWLQERSIGFVEDPTNTDTRFLRNRIRHDVLPGLSEVFPHIAQAVARSAAHAAQAQDLLDILAQEDALPAMDSDGQALRIPRLQLLSRQRQANVVRWWLKRAHGVIGSTAQLDELLRQIEVCITRGHQIHLKVGQGFVRRIGEKLHWYNPALLPNNK